MARFFVEVAYLGTNYSGFQIQKNANSIQQELEKALFIYYKDKIELTGSSRTDAGVHALCNFFHFDSGLEIEQQHRYNINALLPKDIVVKGILAVKDDAHCRFDAISREYKYYIINQKNPFLIDTAWLYPYKVDLTKLNQAAELILQNTNFQSFSKKKTQVNNFLCTIHTSNWYIDNRTNCLVYHVIGNRFLRGMVKGLVSTMLRVATEKITLEEFDTIIKSNNPAKADFSAPSKGLFLCNVAFNQSVSIVAKL